MTEYTYINIQLCTRFSEHTWVLVLVSVFLCNHALLGKCTILTHWIFAHRTNELDRAHKVIGQENYILQCIIELK